MHGRPRKAPTEEEQEASVVKGAKLRSIQAKFFQFHHTNTYTKEALEVNAKLLEMNPEFITGWNYRKLAVQYHLEAAQSDEDSIKSILDEELKVVESALMTNFKSYGAWHHRKWVLNMGHSSTDRELFLLKKFQKLDARNFHAWNYRRFVTALKNIPDEEELQYTTDMIYENFSNYSAWHNRSVLLSRLLKEEVEGYYPKEKVLTEELEFVRNALFTDPDDQSGWFYHLWLLDQTVKLEHLLVSSWPPNGSNVNVSDYCALSPSLSSISRTLPLILCFSEAVGGINSSTVSVVCESNMDSNLIWTPISVDKSGLARTWLTYLTFSSEPMHPSRNYLVKVSIANSEGIISSAGFCCSNPSHMAFTVCLPSSNTEFDEGPDIERIDWSEENFSSNQLHSENLGLINSFNELTISGDNKKTYETNAKIIADEIDYCRELLSEMDCKIGKLTLARLLLAYDALSSASRGVQDQNMFQYKEILELYHDLMKLDPPHFQYYKDQYSLVFLKQELANEESLLKYCYQYRDSTSLSNNSLCLCLRGLSLSQIGCIERLLWVQMLDLSNNGIRSIEGLESLQLLCCLNLSNNKICSFSALEPLRLLKSLKVLDISHNEIGAHPIDTRRYLCASPLSHTSDWKREEFVVSGPEMTIYWDAFSIFSGLNLRQLSVTGNPIADKKFKLFLCKLLPAMKWLDDEKLR
ncbi:unnamed protein product [Coffea canephora]|uniref:Geranylgeranyl transferase type-2 subunit alpha n=1 Tax=Coffea canephora TaxID=49390 RepID=A0A068UV51_COFCA|nr:unnamed protein product [Coffea canephora]